MTDNRVIIAGGGIGGLALALTLHEIGQPFTLYEAVPELKPLGVGINLQPNAVRELTDMGLGPEALDSIGLPAREWALVGLNGRDIHAEPRGLEAGYRWPQYAVHRGALQGLLYRSLCARAGADAVRLGARVSGYSHRPEGGVTVQIDGPEGRFEDSAALLVSAEGIHSAVRAQMHPEQPPIHWGGALMWRGVTRARPIRSGASFVGLGTHNHRVVLYPISAPDQSGRALINWIAERRLEPGEDWQHSGWFRPVAAESFAHHFADFRYDWLDMPALIAGAETVYENPMIDRDPVPTWVDGPVALMGDAAHPMYPTGSNGASQAVIDARVLGQCLLQHGATPRALAAYDARLCTPISALVLRNRGAGPFGLLDRVHARCGGQFEDIETVLPETERRAFLADYKRAAGFAVEALNAAPRMIPEGARIAP